jgi:4-hydroxy-2-oxoheptanedioate aldolase
MTGIKERLRYGTEPLTGFVNIIPSAVATQAFAAAGVDVVLLDQEHGPIGPESLHAMIASTAGTSCSPWVRVPRRDEACVKTALDAGAEGIAFPLVSTAEEAAECVALTRYPPHGRRGWGPFVAHSRWGVNLFDYTAQRGGATVCALWIETRRAMRTSATFAKSKVWTA